MFQFVGYDFFGAEDALNQAPGKTGDLTSSELSNAIFDHFNVSGNTSQYGDTNIPMWDYDTILNATFDNSTNAGNLDYMISQTSGIEIKRRVKGTFDWVTLQYIPIENVDSLVFTFNDYMNAYGEEYEYALVPIVSGVEGNYVIDSIISKFNGVFIGDAEQSFKFLYDVQFQSNTRNQQVGVFMPLGREFPIVVANGVLSYETGTASGAILADSYDDTRIIDRFANVRKENAIKDFLTNKKPKILKDWNGRIWLVIVTGNPQVEYKEGSGMGIAQVSFDWTEIGKTDNQQDLYDAGITNIID